MPVGSVPLHLRLGLGAEFSPVVVRSEVATRLVDVSLGKTTNDPLEDRLLDRISARAAGDGGDSDGHEVAQRGEDGAAAPANRSEPGVDRSAFGEGSVDVERCDDGWTIGEGAEALGEVIGHGPPEGSAAHRPTVENGERCGIPIFHKVD